MAKKEPEAIKDLVERLQDSLSKAEDNVAKTFKELTDKLAEAQLEAKKRFDELVESLTGTELKALPQDVLAKVTDLREQLEGKLDSASMFAALGLATKADLQESNRKIAALQRRVKELEGNKKPRPRADA